MFTCCYHCVDRYTENLTIYDTLQDVYLLALGSTAEFTFLAIANDANNLEYFYRRTDGNPIGSKKSGQITINITRLVCICAKICLFITTIQ